jgi:ubiquinone/menaquinone biosynthesis C-methylase UbiE
MTRIAEVTTALGRRFARVATDVVVRRPALWRLFRPLMRRQFDRLATRWDAMRDPDHLAAFERALAAVERAPEGALDVGTGTGAGAFAIARRWPGVEVIGVDVAAEMVAEARRKTTSDLAARVRFEQADAARLPFESESFDLVGLANMIPFFDELARVVAPGGAVVFGFSAGPETPIYVKSERLRHELSRRGFADFAEFAAGRGSALLARKRSRD